MVTSSSGDKSAGAADTVSIAEIRLGHQYSPSRSSSRATADDARIRNTWFTLVTHQSFSTNHCVLSSTAKRIEKVRLQQPNLYLDNSQPRFAEWEQDEVMTLCGYTVSQRAKRSVHGLIRRRQIAVTHYRDGQSQRPRSTSPISEQRDISASVHGPATPADSRFPTAGTTILSADAVGNTPRRCAGIERNAIACEPPTPSLASQVVRYSDPEESGGYEGEGRIQ
jgi:hypothetical protein